MQVDLTGIDVEQVPAGLPAQRRRGNAGGDENPPETGDVGVEDVARLGGRSVGPHAVDESVRRNRAPGVDEERGEQCALLAGAQRDPVPRCEQLDLAESPESTDLSAGCVPGPNPRSSSYPRSATGHH
jgi:hypothetical protein